MVNHSRRRPQGPRLCVDVATVLLCAALTSTHEKTCSTESVTIIQVITDIPLTKNWCVGLNTYSTSKSSKWSPWIAPVLSVFYISLPLGLDLYGTFYLDMPDKFAPVKPSTKSCTQEILITQRSYVGGLWTHKNLTNILTQSLTGWDTAAFGGRAELFV